MEINIVKKRIIEKIKKIFFKGFPVSVFFYISLTKYFPINGYSITKNMANSKLENKIKKIERTNHEKLRNKITKDLKMHFTAANWNKKNITKLIINKEGKIIGYRFYKTFCPNYFTNSQNKNMMMKSKFFQENKKPFLIIIKYN